MRLDNPDKSSAYPSCDKPGRSGTSLITSAPRNLVSIMGAEIESPEKVMIMKIDIRKEEGAATAKLSATNL
jgi:hypothetical protein